MSSRSRAAREAPASAEPAKPQNLAEFSDSEDEAMTNRIGNVPLSWYDDEDHIGYDIYGNKIAKKDHGDSIDAFIARTDDPNAFRTVYDALNDEKIVLTDEELSIINRIRKGKFPHRSFDPYEDYSAPVEVEVAQLHNPIEPKRRWQPSKWEAKKVVKIVHSLRNGWLRDPTLPRETKPEGIDDVFDLWGDDIEAEKQDPRRRFFAPPRRPPPGHVESFNPPPEYLLTQEEKDIEASKEMAYRRFPFTPTIHTSLRAVPAYERLMRERFERCLDLYLAVRERREYKKERFDVENLIPKLPKPKDLRPFPSQLSLEYVGHTGAVRSLDVSPDGQWLVSGSEDGTVRVWEVTTARCARVWHLKERVVSVSWNPNPSMPLVACALSSGVAVLHTGTGTPEQGANAEHILRAAPVIFKQGMSVVRAAAGSSERAGAAAISRAEKMTKLVQWVSWWRRNDADIEEEFAPEKDGKDAAGVDVEAKKREAVAIATLAKQAEMGIPVDANVKAVKEATANVPDVSPASAAASEAGKKRAAADAAEANGDDVILSLEDAAEWDATQGLARLLIRIKAGVSNVAWHGKGDYLATVSPVATATAVCVHRLSAAASQLPFNKSKGLVQQVAFHPTRPLFIVSTQRHIRMYSLLTQKPAKTLQCPSRWVSGFAIHPRGEHILVGGYDRKVSWFDLEQAEQPYKTLRYHRRGVRAVAFHKRYPLFVTGSDDGCLHVMHGTVYDDLVTDPLLVPLKIINAHVPVDDVGVLSTVFHPNQPWVFSSAADKTIRLFS